MRDSIEGSSLLQVFREKNHGTEAKDRQGEPEDAFQRVAKLILLSHRNEREDKQCYPEKPGKEIARSRCCEFFHSVILSSLAEWA